MILDAIRNVVPIKYRQSFGLWTAHQASRSVLTLYPYLFLLCGAIPKHLRLLPNDECYVTYRGHQITFPRDGIFTSWEVLQDEIYEKMGQPKIGDTVVDIGAYTGMFTVKAAIQVGKTTGKVIAIEPSSHNMKYLCRNTTDLPQVTVVHAAAGSSKRNGALSVSVASPCHTLQSRPNSRTETVKVDTLDNILSELHIVEVNFIKVDAEGSELEIIKGAVNTLKNNRLRISVAAYHELPNGERELPYVSNLLESMNFHVTVIKDYVYAHNLWRKG